jgi:hypothetical protein
MAGVDLSGVLRWLEGEHEKIIPPRSFWRRCYGRGIRPCKNARADMASPPEAMSCFQVALFDPTNARTLKSLNIMTDIPGRQR